VKKLREDRARGRWGFFWPTIIFALFSFSGVIRWAGLWDNFPPTLWATCDGLDRIGNVAVSLAGRLFEQSSKAFGGPLRQLSSTLNVPGVVVLLVKHIGGKGSAEPHVDESL